MKTKKQESATARFEQALANREQVQYLLRLYVAGMTQHSANAIANAKKICEDNLKGRYDLQVIDIYQQPALPEGEQIVAVPTLIKKLPLPLRRIVGDLSDRDQVLVGLDLKPKN